MPREVVYLGLSRAQAMQTKEKPFMDPRAQVRLDYTGMESIRILDRELISSCLSICHGCESSE